LAFIVLLVLVQSEGEEPDEGAEVREYVPGVLSKSFYRPRNFPITDIGVWDEDTAYFSSRHSVKKIDEGHLMPMNGMEVGGGDEIIAFHLCHNRNSFFYEVQAEDGGTVTIFEHHLDDDHRVEVWKNEEDASSAKSLLCVGKLLLRASQDDLLAIDIERSESDHEHPSVSVLRKYDRNDDDALVITSLATHFANDVYTNQQVYGLVPRNRTLLKLHLETDHETEKVIAKSEILLSGGDGSDGDRDSASLLDPLFVLSLHDSVLFADGCALRQISRDERVRTLMGAPRECTSPQNQTVEPVPWATRLSPLQALAGSPEGTRYGVALALTKEEVVSVVQREDSYCAELDSEDCLAHPGCGWAQGEKLHEQLCFDCDALRQWESARKDIVGEDIDICLFEAAPRARTTYRLGGCGCAAPETTPQPDADGVGLTILQFFIGGSVIIGGCLGGLTYIRAQKRRAALAREMYGSIDCCEFHVFTDEEAGN